MSLAPAGWYDVRGRAENARLACGGGVADNKPKPIQRISPQAHLRLDPLGFFGDHAARGMNAAENLLNGDNHSRLVVPRTEQSEQDNQGNRHGNNRHASTAGAS